MLKILLKLDIHILVAKVANLLQSAYTVLSINFVGIPKQNQ